MLDIFHKLVKCGLASDVRAVTSATALADEEYTASLACAQARFLGLQDGKTDESKPNAAEQDNKREQMQLAVDITHWAKSAGLLDPEWGMQEHWTGGVPRFPKVWAVYCRAYDKTNPCKGGSD